MAAHGIAQAPGSFVRVRQTLSLRVTTTADHNVSLERRRLPRQDIPAESERGRYRKPLAR
jgi:hypothetical protein